MTGLRHTLINLAFIVFWFLSLLVVGLGAYSNGFDNGYHNGVYNACPGR